MRAIGVTLFALTVLVALLFLPAGAPNASGVSVYEIHPGGEGNLVRFRSKAPLETVEGTTRMVSGRIEADLENLSDSVRIAVEVDLASIDTGIDLRNKHMRENHLHTDRFPKAIFRGGRIKGKEGGALAPGGKVRFQIAGDFTIHGVTRPLTAPVEVTRSKDDSLIVESSFVVLLSDFEIPRPEFLLLRLDEKQEVLVRLVAVPAAPRQETQETKE